MYKVKCASYAYDAYELEDKNMSKVIHMKNLLKHNKNVIDALNEFLGKVDNSMREFAKADDFDPSFILPLITQNLNEYANSLIIEPADMIDAKFDIVDDEDKR